MTRLADMVAALPSPPKERPARRQPAPRVVEQPALTVDDYELPERASSTKSASDAPGKFTEYRGKPTADGHESPAMRGNRREHERRKVFEDLWTELRHELPDADRSGLAKVLRELAASPVDIMERDALIRLAAWAIAAASEKAYEMPATPPPVPEVFAEMDAA